MEQYDRDSDTGEPNEPVGDWTGLTLDDMKGREPPGFWGPNQPSDYDSDKWNEDIVNLEQNITGFNAPGTTQEQLDERDGNETYGDPPDKDTEEVDLGGGYTDSDD